ncbi:ferredoxin [Kitasatospora sp. NPDC051853]|uniref:ferredoxin n=1 Tax=Kitasatospora sp. NPDC051853 TaxID=3364058 RepID=UPI0037BC722D
MTLYFDAAAVLFEAHPSYTGRWEDRLWLNVPGPVYGGETDNCGTGRLHAPRHVLYGDDYFGEYVYRQPRTPGEAADVLVAIEEEPWGGYNCDGDQRWTPDLVREWWRDRGRVLEYLRDQSREWERIDTMDPRQHTVEGVRDFAAYITGGTDSGSLETDLRTYLYWLEERRSPTPDDLLPDLAPARAPRRSP